MVASSSISGFAEEAVEDLSVGFWLGVKPGIIIFGWLSFGLGSNNPTARSLLFRIYDKITKIKI